MRWFAWVIVLVFAAVVLEALYGCAAAPVAPVASPAAPPGAKPPAQVSDASLDGIKQIAGASACASVSFANRGRPPVGYIKGMALVYAKELCANAVPAALGGSGSDALALYGVQPTLRNTFMLLIGLGMRESSGRYCVGRDTSASNTTSDTAEAGAFQASYNSRSASPVLPALFAKYRSSQVGCFLDVFKEGARPCSSGDGGLQNFGSGDGFAFQKLEKECPAFAAEYAAIGIRVLRKHWGPLNRQEAEMRPECGSMLDQVKALVDAHPEVCAAL